VAELTVIRWRDIPAQVTATNGAATVRRELPERFQKAIDAAAMKAGLIESDAYLEGWRRDTRPCGEELEAEVQAEAERLEAAYDRAALLRLTRSGGLDGG
jgi:hypothetical protein